LIREWRPNPRLTIVLRRNALVGTIYDAKEAVGEPREIARVISWGEARVPQAMKIELWARIWVAPRHLTQIGIRMIFWR
jgi:hypothetical protein